ncbi:MAG: hypothetical protein ACLGQX_02170 [Acidobacteriota bacterium]
MARAYDDGLRRKMFQAQADQFDAVGHPDQRAENGSAKLDRTHLDQKGKMVFGMVADNLSRQLVELGPDVIGTAAPPAQTSK